MWNVSFEIIGFSCLLWNRKSKQKLLITSYCREFWPLRILESITWKARTSRYKIIRYSDRESGTWRLVICPWLNRWEIRALGWGCKPGAFDSNIYAFNAKEIGHLGFYVIDSHEWDVLSVSVLLIYSVRIHLKSVLATSYVFTITEKESFNLGTFITIAIHIWRAK